MTWDVSGPCSMLPWPWPYFQEDKDRIPWPMQSDYGDSRHILRTQMAMDRMASSAV